MTTSSPLSHSEEEAKECVCGHREDEHGRIPGRAPWMPEGADQGPVCHQCWAEHLDGVDDDHVLRYAHEFTAPAPAVNARLRSLSQGGQP